jgi:pyrroline-5-carboxylate reductase
MKILVLGAGNMVAAILEGLKNETDMSHFYLYSPSGKSAKELAAKVGANFVSTLDEINDPVWVWIGCKPQQLKDLGKSIQGKFPQATFVSMLAALKESDQLNVLGAQKLIRIMPNLPVRFKKGITLLSSLSASAELKQMKTLFSTIGLTQEVNEDELEELTLLTGSGPALFYEFTKILAASFTSLNEEQRENLSRMVMIGSGVSVGSSEENLSHMIDNVTSKAGVTIAVLNEWRDLKLNELIQKGIVAGKKRTSEITQSLRQS